MNFSQIIQQLPDYEGPDAAVTEVCAAAAAAGAAFLAGGNEQVGRACARVIGDQKKRW